MESIQKTKSEENQPQGRPKQLSCIEEIISIDDVLNAISKVECPKSARQSASRTSMEDFCPYPEEQAPYTFQNDWIYKA